MRFEVGTYPLYERKHTKNIKLVFKFVRTWKEKKKKSKNLYKLLRIHKIVASKIWNFKLVL